MKEFDAAALAEYQALRDEIARHENQIFEIFKFALTGAVAIIAFGLQQYAGDPPNPNAWAIVATVPLIIVPAGLFSLARAQMEMRIGAYIQAYFEEGSPSMNWDQALQERSHPSDGRAADNGPDLWLKSAIFSGYVMVGLAGLGIAWLLAPSTELAQGVMWAETGMVAAIAIGATWVLSRSDRSALESPDLAAFRSLAARSTSEREGRYHCGPDDD